MFAASVEAAGAGVQRFESGAELREFIEHLAFCSICLKVDASLLDDDIAILTAKDLVHSVVAYGRVC